MADNATKATLPQPIVAPQRRPPRKPSRVFRRTTMRRAIGEGLALYLLAQALGMVPFGFWPPFLVPVVLLASTALFILPPVWAAMRVVSTKREKMSRRFWRLGPILAAWCAAASVLLALFVGETALFVGLATPPDITRFAMHGASALSPRDFVAGQVVHFVGLALYFTIAVVCTRLANGGFLRFTMPAGKGRVTL